MWQCRPKKSVEFAIACGDETPITKREWLILFGGVALSWVIHGIFGFSLLSV
jgi:hypothetical protein